MIVFFFFLPISTTIHFNKSFLKDFALISPDPLPKCLTIQLLMIYSMLNLLVVLWKGPMQQEGPAGVKKKKKPDSIELPGWVRALQSWALMSESYICVSGARNPSIKLKMSNGDRTWANTAHRCKWTFLLSAAWVYKESEGRVFEDRLPATCLLFSEASEARAYDIVMIRSCSWRAESSSDSTSLSTATAGGIFCTLTQKHTHKLFYSPVFMIKIRTRPHPRTKFHSRRTIHRP